MHRYYFISSPLHFCVASSIAMQHENDLNIAVFVQGSQTFIKKYGEAAEQSPAELLFLCGEYLSLEFHMLPLR